jgi:hypothetical protein
MTLAPVSGPDNTVLFDEPALPNAVDHPSATQRADLDAIDLGSVIGQLLVADPTIATLTPASLLASAGPTVIAVNGSNYLPNSVVEVNQAGVATTFVDAQNLTFTFDPTVAGSFNVTVRNTVEESNDVVLTVTAGTSEDPDPEPDVFDGTSDPGDFTIAVIQAYINGLPNQGHGEDEVQRVLDLERAGQNRVTLVEWLDAKMGAE